MAKTVTKKVSRVKVKKKIWYKILASKQFGQKEVGEIYLNTPENAVGRIVKINLRDITGNVKDQNSYIVFRIDRAEATTLHTVPIGYELVSAYLKRQVRKNADKVDDCFTLKTKDGSEVLLKVLMITVNKTQASVRTQLRKKLQELLQEELAKEHFSVFIGNVISYKIRSQLKKSLSKIYPVREVALRVIRLQEGKKQSMIKDGGKPTKTIPPPSAPKSPTEETTETKETKEEPTSASTPPPAPEPEPEPEEPKGVIEDKKEPIKEESKET